MPIIELKDVKKIYLMDKVEVPALNGVSLEIEAGEYISLMGSSGSGKSTLMNIVGALDRPTSGKVFVDGKDISKLTDSQLAIIRRKKIGFIFQQFNLINKLTALENVELPMWFAGLSKGQRVKRAADLLKLVGLEKRLHHKPTELSGGERQRVAIARSLGNDPDIILADEPTGNLDSVSGTEVVKILEDFNNQGKTLIVVTHDPKFGKRAKRCVNMEDGMILDCDRK